MGMLGTPKPGPYLRNFRGCWPTAPFALVVYVWQNFVCGYTLLLCILDVGIRPPPGFEAAFTGDMSLGEAFAALARRPMPANRSRSPSPFDNGRSPSQSRAHSQSRSPSPASGAEDGRRYDRHYRDARRQDRGGDYHRHHRSDYADGRDGRDRREYREHESRRRHHEREQRERRDDKERDRHRDRDRYEREVGGSVVLVCVGRGAVTSDPKAEGF